MRGAPVTESLLYSSHGSYGWSHGACDRNKQFTLPQVVQTHRKSSQAPTSVHHLVFQSQGLDGIKHIQDIPDNS